MTNGATQYLTPEGRARLESELEELTTVRRKQIADALRSAIREGDLSENFGYSETKRQQALLEGRIRELQALLAKAETLETTTDGLAALGSTVRLQEAGQSPETYQIVGPAETNPRLRRISNESPLGRALIGHRPGDQVQVDTPGGTLVFKILSIE